MALQAPLTLLALATLVLTAVVCDLRTRRIPNTLVSIGIALGFLFQIVVLMGGNHSVNRIGASDLGSALLGGLIGLGLFLPFYALRTMGAGDVKLLAMVGIWLGPQHVVWATLWTMVAGGLLALAVALGTGVLRPVISNLHAMIVTSLMHVQTGGPVGVTAPSETTGRLPYAAAIACGTAAEIVRVLIL